MIVARDSRSRHALGTIHLVAHYEALERLTRGSSQPARMRLERTLGAELASRLVGGLARRGRAAS